MAGDKIPYHLRPNKFVEREIFSELLLKLSRWINLNESMYVSMGGPFLLDFRLIARKTDFKKMLSLETTRYVFSRQKFNNTISNVICNNIGSNDFVARFDDWVKKYKAENAVVWFDYASAKRKQQLEETTRLVEKLAENDVIKITVNIAPKTLCEGAHDETAIKQKEIIFKNLEEIYGDLFPASEFSPTDMKLDGIAKSISRVVELAYAHALRADPDYRMLPLSIMTYNDGFHDMMTICAIKIKESNIKEFKKKTKIEKWSYYSTSHADIKKVAVPELSIKEREKIHGLIVSHGSDSKLIHDGMGFQLGKGTSSLETLNAYIANQNYCPYVFLSKDNKLRKSIINYFESFI